MNVYFSFFGKAFEQAASSTSCRTIHDAFDSFGKPVLPLGAVLKIIYIELATRNKTCIFIVFNRKMDSIILLQ